MIDESELQRQIESDRRDQQKDVLRLCIAFGLVAIGISPLGLWHTLAVLAGLWWVVIILDGRFASNKSLRWLEEKIMARIGQART